MKGFTVSRPRVWGVGVQSLGCRGLEFRVQLLTVPHARA